MSTVELRPTFHQRVSMVTRQIWSLHILRGLAWTVVVAAVVLTVLASLDYFLELAWPIRALLLSLGVGILAILAWHWVIRPARFWTKTRVAFELEGLFPRLGQRLRTATQHGGKPEGDLIRDGVAPHLVVALEEETAAKTRPLPFQAILPVRPMLLATAAGIAAATLIALSLINNPEWETALRRVVLALDPYTTLSVSANATRVDEGASVDIRACLSGRSRPEVILHVREEGDLEWRQETMDVGEGEFTARLTRMRATTEFFVTAGPERTAIQQVVVQRPLKFLETRVEVVSPAYTGLAPMVHPSGSFSAVQGSLARLHLTLDRSPVEAFLVVKDLTKPSAPPRRLEMSIENQHLSAELTLSADLEYSILAHDADGIPTIPNRHRVRVTIDQPPTITFDSPTESLEVHTLAEVLMRVRARDDFGITKVGIVFQINNEEERTLVLNQVEQPCQREAQAAQVLMLEQFLLTQKDCVAYYAYAEDNRPETPLRATTELRFLDIRPFLRTYRLVDPGEEMPGNRRDLIFLDEVIARQRYNLNQTLRLETRSQARLDLAQVEKVAAFENKLATQTHELADFLAGLGVDGTAILAQAEEAMLSAVDSLQGAKFATAINQERDALRYLMEARNTVQQSLVKQTRAVRAQAKAFDRMQRQKLRRENEKAETLPQIAAELAKLANEEEEIAGTLGATSAAQAQGENQGTGSPMDPKNAPVPGEKPDPAKPSSTGIGPERKTMSMEKKGSEDPVQERQEDIAARAAVLEKVADKAKGLTPLAKTRIANAAKAANAGADALGQKDRSAARTEVERARESFRQAATQVAALAAEEAAQQIAAARDLANDLALQTAPGDAMNPPGAASKGEGDKPQPGLGNALEQAKTLKDVLDQVAGSGSEGAAEAARKIGGLLKQEDLAAAIARLEQPGTASDREERQDLSERWSALGQKLDQIYRETLAPRLEELARLEREANELERRTRTAEAGAEWRRLGQLGSEFLERLDAAGLGQFANEDLRTGIRSGLAQGNRDTFARGISVAHNHLAAKLREFVAHERFSKGNETVPPEYKDLVDRYIRALSVGSSK